MNDLGASWVTAAESYLLECRATSTSVRASEFALRMNRSPAQLAREFHTSVGATVKDYLSVRQIEHAKELLRHTVRSTAQIAVAAGFGTSRSFYRAFRRLTGFSPTAFRQEMSLGAPAGRH
jgi:AraC-like DNA-binding protein